MEGRVLKGGTYASVELTSTDTWLRKETLWYSDAAIPPARVDDQGVKKLCSLTYSIPYGEIQKLPTYVSAGKTWRDVHYSRDILCGSANLEYRVNFKGRLLQSVEADYIDDF